MRNELNDIQTKMDYLNKYRKTSIGKEDIFKGLDLIQIFNILIALLDFVQEIKSLFRKGVKWWQLWKFLSLRKMVVAFIKKVSKITN